MAVQAIGERVRREEDYRLLTGKGRYVEDVPAIGAARGYVLRSPHAHARIVSIDAEPAKAAPGILAVLTGADLRRRGLGTLRPLVPRRKRDGSAGFACPQPLLVQDRVRYVGDPVAFVVAESLHQAKDAAELIQVEYEPLPATATADAALAPGAPVVWEQNPGNEAFTHSAGDKAATDAAFARAARVVRHQVVNDLPLGRSVDEALRMVKALQFTEKHGEVCPANWTKGKVGEGKKTAHRHP